MNDIRLTSTRRGFLGGLAALAAVRTFGDPGDAEPVVRFGYITDCHYAAHLADSYGRRYSQGLVKMRAFAAAMRELKPDFVVEGGDFKDLGRTPEESLRYVAEIEREFAACGLPRYHVVGNHDQDNLSKEEFLGAVANEGQDAARAYYAFEKGGVKFIVLDACYRYDGQPYCRGNFHWREAFLPAEQIEFLKAELASAKGPCVPLVHQQLDAEDDTCIRNAAEVRAILKASGKVRFVVQGHLHEGAFREIDGIGYVTSAASVMGAAPEANAFSLFEVFPSGAVRVKSYNPAKTVETSYLPGAWESRGEWKSGHYQVHYIYTGRSECMFHIFPDGTTMMLDCGDSMRFFRTPAEVPLPGSPSVRAGEFAARYVMEHSPKGNQVDIFHLSHYHADHFGGQFYHGGEMGKSSLGTFCKAGLADAARFLRFGRVIDRAWPDFNEPQDLLALDTGRNREPEQVRAVYAHLAETQGTKIERFELGARPKFGALELFNVCSCGKYVRKDGTIRDLFEKRAAQKPKNRLNENPLSCGFVATLGKFRYFSAGDFSDWWTWDGCAGGRQIEDELAEAVGPVSVAKLNHHGHHSMSQGLVKALRARVWTSCSLDQQHCTDDTMTRLTDRSLYPGERLLLPTYLPTNRPKTEFGRAYLKDAARCVVDTPCHVVLDVPPGGESYTLTCRSATRPGNPLVGEFSFFV